MKQTLLIETIMGQTRLAVVEDGRLCELYIDRPGSACEAGDIFLGRVENVLPGMNAAFVDIGAEKNGFLCASDVPAAALGDAALAERIGRERIEARVRPGQEILVQVTKEQSGAKGPRLNSHATLPGRLMVLMPGVSYVGVSRKIADEAERARLRQIGIELMGDGGDGMILRTAAQGASEEEIAAERDALCAAWSDIAIRAGRSAAPKLLHAENDLELLAVRDLLGEDTEALWTEGGALCERIKALASDRAPRWADRVRAHEGTVPLFDLFRVDEQLDKALQKYVWLKNGGSLVIEETEALTVIDVNTGKYTGRRDAEETVFQNNCEAAREVMRQIRLRNISGIIVVDFIDMKDARHREALLDALRCEARRDRNRVSVVGITPLGLVEMTRKKQRLPLDRQLLHKCSDCGGNGAVPSHETAARRIVRDLWRRRRSGQDNAILAEAPEAVCGWLKTIGAPAGGATYALPRSDLRAGEYRLSPADEGALPKGAIRLK